VRPSEASLAALALLCERRKTMVFALDVNGSAGELHALLPHAHVVQVPYETDWMERDAITVGV
jgi:hypothetical protein